MISLFLLHGRLHLFFSSEGYIGIIKELDTCGDGELQSKAEDYDSIYFSKVRE